jgi:hypothetical protein
VPGRIPTRVVPSAKLSRRTPRQVRESFESLLDGGIALRVAGTAKSRPRRLLRLGYEPHFSLELFGTRFFLSRAHQNEDIRFFVAYLLQTHPSTGRSEIYARLFYKDVSLVWRSASHFVRSENENWIGKGDVAIIVRDGEEIEESAEETTDLPFELQSALEAALRRSDLIARDERAVALILRRGGDNRIRAYEDFVGPRRRAAAVPGNRIHGGRSIARFPRTNDPRSLVFAKGFEPDFRGGVLESSRMRSRLYGGTVRRFRVISANEKVQYLFFAGPRHVWLGHPQATTTELMSYGVRTIDVHADDRLSIPGYEYHFLDDAEDPPEFVTQIPEGFAGPPSKVDPSRVDTSPWNDLLPVVREFRRRVLGQA